MSRTSTAAAAEDRPAGWGRWAPRVALLAGWERWALRAAIQEGRARWATPAGSATRAGWARPGGSATRAGRGRWATRAGMLGGAALLAGGLAGGVPGPASAQAPDPAQTT